MVSKHSPENDPRTHHPEIDVWLKAAAEVLEEYDEESGEGPAGVV